MKTFSHATLMKMLDAKNVKIKDLTMALKLEKKRNAELISWKKANDKTQAPT